MTRRVVFACAVVALAGCTNRPPVQVPPREPIAVTTAAVAVHAIPQTFERGGVMRAANGATLSSRIVAPVRVVHVTEGTAVRAGQPLLTLDAADLDAASRRAEASAAAAGDTVTAARADRAAADAALTLARATRDRIAMLADRRSATPQELDAANADLQAAEARVASADARIAEATAALAAAREATTAAHASASYAVITAPFDGIVTERLVDPGSLASPGLPLLRIDDVRAFRVEVTVDEAAAAVVVPGSDVEIAFGDAAPATWHAARVAEVARSVDAGTHAFLVKIPVPSQPGLRSGTFARARFPAPARNGLTVPNAAVIMQGQLSTVFVVAEDRARLRVITTGGGDAELEVLSGLSAGERIIVSPPPALHDSDPIRDIARAGP